jgi:hypothetical protein
VTLAAALLLPRGPPPRWALHLLDRMLLRWTRSSAVLRWPWGSDVAMMAIVSSPCSTGLRPVRCLLRLPIGMAKTPDQRVMQRAAPIVTWLTVGHLRCAAGEGDPKQGWPNKASNAAEHLRHVFHRMGLDVSGHKLAHLFDPGRC